MVQPFSAFDTQKFHSEFSTSYSPHVDILKLNSTEISVPENAKQFSGTQQSFFSKSGGFNDIAYLLHV